jgi:hypothetical protein
MTRKVLQLALILTLVCGAPVWSVASGMLAVEQVGEVEPTITFQQSYVIVNGAAGQTLEVVSLTGKCLMTIRIDSPSQRIELNIPKGCYILKVGKVVRKVSVR